MSTRPATRIVACGLAVAVGFVPQIASVSGQPQRFVTSEGRVVVRQLTGAGDWESGRDQQGKRGWQLQIKHLGDDTLAGRIHVVGSAAVQEARVEGRVDGSELYGVLVRDDNQQVGTFSGSLFAEGAAGTYTFSNGDTGNWNWSGPGAKALKESQTDLRSRSDTADPDQPEPE